MTHSTKNLAKQRNNHSISWQQVGSDLGAALSCIDAVNTLNRLKLTACVNIIAIGLMPLKDSVVLEQIDLSLVHEHSMDIYRRVPLLSEKNVIPILDSIVGKEGSSLKHVQLPDFEFIAWEWSDSDSDSLAHGTNGFLKRHDDL